MNTEPLIADFSDVLTRIKEGLLGVLPDVLGAVVLFGVGLILAHLLRGVINRLLRNPDRLITNRKARRSLRPVWIDPSVARVISGLLYWMVVFLFLTAATEMLGFPVVTTWLSGIANYLPRILTAAVIGVAGFVGANLLRDGVTRAAVSVNLAYAETLGKLARFLVLLVSALIAVDLVGLDISLLINMIYIVIGALLLGAALAFGLGSRTVVANILASYYVQKTYQVGHVVRVGSVEGRIIRITPTALVLQTSEEQVLVPAERFSETDSALLQEEG